MSLVEHNNIDFSLVVIQLNWSVSNILMNVKGYLVKFSHVVAGLVELYTLQQFLEFWIMF